jgi:PTH1 family peptidyl-tRNA hydrolase
MAMGMRRRAASELEAANMKLIVGLGNPGGKYKDTRHNVGYEVAARLANKFATGSPRVKFQGEIAEATIAGEKTLVLTPTTYMNASGGSVLEARDFYKIDKDNILVVCDDFALPVARLRLRSKGSSGGQNGLDDVLRRLGTNEIPRLRVGVGPLPPGRDAAGFVLGKFSKEEQFQVAKAIERAAEAIECWVREGLAVAMSRYNSGEQD